MGAGRCSALNGQSDVSAGAGAGKVSCIVAGGGDGTINEVFASVYGAGLPAQCSLGILPLGTANDFAHASKRARGRRI